MSALSKVEMSVSTPFWEFGGCHFDGHGGDEQARAEAPMLEPEDFNSENYRICWPAVLAVFAVQMIVLITLSIAVANHSSFTTASSTDVKAKAPKKVSDVRNTAAMEGKAEVTWTSQSQRD